MDRSRNVVSGQEQKCCPTRCGQGHQTCAGLAGWSVTSPSFVIVLITPESSSPRFPANRSHSLDSR
jgi:hypothetical protein